MTKKKRYRRRSTDPIPPGEQRLYNLSRTVSLACAAFWQSTPERREAAAINHRRATDNNQLFLDDKD